MLRGDATGTKWTNTILGLFERLGKARGYIPDYERRKHDLDWFVSADDEDSAVHFEHENKPSRIKKTVDDLSNSEADVLIGVVYPKSGTHLNEIHEFILTEVTEWTDPSVMLMIFDCVFFQQFPIEILGRVYTIEGWDEDASMRSLRNKDGDDYYYSWLVS